MNRFRQINRNKKLKPFNFVIASVGNRVDPSTNKPIIPIVPYTNRLGIVPYLPFVDYKTGKEYKENTQFYWRPLSEFLSAYLDHNDGKYEGGIGELRRKHIIIDGIEHIGKESNNLEESEVIGVSDNDYVIYDNKTEQKITKFIKKMTVKQAREIGISRRNLFYLRKKLLLSQRILLKKKTVLRLLTLS